MNISVNIKAIREGKRLSQAEVARRMDTSPEFYFRLEKRNNKLSLEQIESIARALEVSVAELIGIETFNINNSPDEIKELLRENEELKEKVAELEDDKKRLKTNESYLMDKFNEVYVSVSFTLLFPYIFHDFMMNVKEDGIIVDTKKIEKLCDMILSIENAPNAIISKDKNLDIMNFVVTKLMDSKHLLIRILTESSGTIVNLNKNISLIQDEYFKFIRHFQDTIDEFERELEKRRASFEN